MYKYPAQVAGGVVEAYTDLVKPRVVAGPEFTAAVEPEVAKMGSNVTVRIYYNGTLVAEFREKASPVLQIDTTSFFREVRVVDALGTPLPDFAIYVGGLKFRGAGGVALIIPIDDKAAVEINGVRYLIQLQPEVKIPTLTKESFLKIAAAAATVGVAVAFGLKRREKPKGEKDEKDLVEV
jgi:hypothetical protein